MDWEMLLTERYDWQEETIRQIKDKMINKPPSNNQMNIKEDKLAVIFGPSQIGKTTLILHLMGILEDKLEKIYDVLRADIKRGNSSTSTAIIYQRSQTDAYGLRYETAKEKENEKNDDKEQTDEEQVDEKELNEKELNENYNLTEAEFVAELKKLRALVESGNAKTDVLNIYIPSSYFGRDEKNANISIVDLPGIESSNPKEASHTQQLVKKYMTIATVNIIVCRADRIQTLETLQMPGKWDWKSQSQRYILVLTNAYGEGSIKKYFNQPPELRQKTFFEFVKDSYKKEVTKVIGDESGIEYFPIDIGDSLNKLCEARPKEAEEIRNLVADVSEEIKQAIQQRQGNRLSALIKSWDGYLSFIVHGKEEDLAAQDSEAEYSLKQAKKKRNERQKKLDSCNDYLKQGSESTIAYNRYLELEKKAADYRWQGTGTENDLPHFCTPIVEEMNEILGEDKYSTVFGNLNDKKKEIRDIFEKKMQELSESYLKEWRIIFEVQCYRNHNSKNAEGDSEEDENTEEDLEEDENAEEDSEEDAGEDIDKIMTDFANNQYRKILLDDGLIYDLSYELYADTAGLIQKMQKKKTIGRAKSIVEEYIKKYFKQFLDAVLQYAEAIILDRREIKLNYERTGRLAQDYERELNHLSATISHLESQRKDIQNKLSLLQQQKEEDEKQLKDYKAIAEQQYKKQKDRIYKKMKRCKAKDMELMQYMTFLALMEKDFRVALQYGG